MNRDRLLKIFGIGAVLILCGVILGLFVGRSIPADVQGDEEVYVDPVERFELGRDSFTPPKVARRKKVHVQPNEHREYGIRRNGKRLLVPNESAKKKERMQLVEEQREMDAWRQDSFGEPSKLSKDTHATSGTTSQPAIDPIDVNSVDDSPPVTVNGQTLKSGQPDSGTAEVAP